MTDRSTEHDFEDAPNLNTDLNLDFKLPLLGWFRFDRYTVRSINDLVVERYAGEYLIDFKKTRLYFQPTWELGPDDVLFSYQGWIRSRQLE